MQETLAKFPAQQKHKRITKGFLPKPSAQQNHNRITKGLFLLGFSCAATQKNVNRTCSRAHHANPEESRTKDSRRNELEVHKVTQPRNGHVMFTSRELRWRAAARVRALKLKKQSIRMSRETVETKITGLWTANPRA